MKRPENTQSKLQSKFCSKLEATMPRALSRSVALCWLLIFSVLCRVSGEEVGAPKSKVTLKATAKDVGTTVSSGVKAGVKAAPRLAKFALKTGLFAASAYLNPIGTALVAINAVVKCGVDAVEAMRSWATWDKKLHEAKCASSIQKYLHTTETLEIIKLTALIGETALKDKGNSYNKLDPLLETPSECVTLWP